MNGPSPTRSRENALRTILITGTCTLGVEEVAFFDVLSETVAPPKRRK
jgi:hypothetical protein